jgi:hypothetical protein
VWEYYLGDCYLDAMWFPDWPGRETEVSGLGAASKFPIAGVPVVLCEAKIRLTPELIGQGLLYGVLARRLGAQVRSTIIFVESTPADSFKTAAEELGLKVVLSSTAQADPP